MDVTLESGHEQARRWNGVAGRAWVDAQELLDRTFKPLEDRLVAAASTVSPGTVLDVGCGTGSTTLAIARRLGPESRAIGIDLSEPMIAAARARAERDRIPAQFICANAQDHAFEPGSVDAIVSRFGVMFFDDPVRAFANFRHAASDHARMQIIAWRSAADNPFMTTAERAAAPLLPNLPPRRPDAPGQFAFGHRERVQHILEHSGWADVEIRPIDFACAFPEHELVGYLTRLGPVGMILHEADERTRERVIEAVRPAFDPYVHGAEVRFTASCWMVSAQNRR